MEDKKEIEIIDNNLNTIDSVCKNTLVQDSGKFNIHLL